MMGNSHPSSTQLDEDQQQHRSRSIDQEETAGRFDAAGPCDEERKSSPDLNFERGAAHPSSDVNSEPPPEIQDNRLSEDPSAEIQKTIIEAAANLTPELQQKLHSLLSEHPRGIKVSQVMRNSTGLMRYIQPYANELQLPPIQILFDFLLHCEGVVGRRNIDGRMFFFLENQNEMKSNMAEASLETQSSGKLSFEEYSTAEAIEAAATGLSPRLHQRLLALLAEHPDGITASQVMRNTKGLTSYIQSCASEAGKDFLPPGPFLSSCDGICVRKVAGRTLYFLENGKGMMPTQCATTDGAAAIELVKQLEKTYRNRPWPGTRKQLESYLVSVDPQSSPVFVLWLEKGLEDGLSDSERRKEIIKRAMQQLRRMRCVRGTNSYLVWDHDKIRSIVDKQESTTVAPSVAQENLGVLERIPVNFPGGSTPTRLIDTDEKLEAVMMDYPFNPQAIPVVGEDNIVAIDCEGVPENLFLIQVATWAATYVFDCIKLGAKEMCTSLQPLLMGPHVRKLFHDLHNDAAALASIGGVPVLYTIDTQLAMEAVTGELHVGFNQMLVQLGHDIHPLKKSLKSKMDGGHIFAQRPIPPDVLEYVALDVSLLLKVKGSLFSVLSSMRDSIQRASDTRATIAAASGGLRQVCFDISNSYSISSRELIQEMRPGDMLAPVPLRVSDDTDILLEMLPDDLCKDLAGQTEHLSDVVLDKGRKPLAWIDGNRVFLGKENRMVSQDDINGIVERLGGFGGDNRAGLERQLHRISAMRNRQQDIIGLTLRVGRHVSGNATMISDLMFADSSQSILFLGEPGSGKTTVVREVTKQLAERFNVCIVDTSNEIAGDGDIPHPCVGYARRMMVPSLDRQSDVMVECVQNHTPEVMVIDEIGRPTEVEAARTCKQRGVRLIASAHGDLRKLIKNPKLRGLVGGVETVTLGDTEAKKEAKTSGNPRARGGLQKLKAQRAGPPTFDIIVELRRGAPHEWRIVLDVGDAVDRVLEGQLYKAQRRTRDPATGSLALQLERA